MTHSSLLADLINLNHALDADLAIDLDQRRQRDRVFGRAMQRYRDKPVAQIRAWLREQQGPENSSGVQGSRLYYSLCLVLLFAGLVGGWGLASAVLAYDGNRPINIVNAVVVLVLPQILLLLVWLLTVLPGRVPLFADVRATLEFLNPGRLAGRLAAGFDNRHPQPGLALVWSPDNAVVLAPAARWLFSFWSQLFAVSFNVGVLASAFFLVSFSDLAFVWSTTLSIDNDSFHRLLVLLSAPWSGLFPDAVPGAELVAKSRYYRLEEGALAGHGATLQLAVELGQWWPFLIAAVGCYGLLPRLATLAISWYRFRFHLRRALCNLPGAPELLARMNSPLVSTLASEPEHALKMAAGDADSGMTPGHYALRCPVIDWAGTVNSADDIGRRLAALGIEVLEMLRAGGRQSTEQDQALVTSLCRRKPSGVGILVRAWEPPLHDLLDFVAAIRKRCGAATPIILLLWAGRDGVTVAELETWQLSVSQLADPELHLENVGVTA